MLLLSFLFLLGTLCLVVRAMQVTFPSTGDMWVSLGPCLIEWEIVDTDPSAMAIVLTNQDRSVLPVNNVLLASNIPTSKGSITIKSTSSSGFSVGAGYVVNLVKAPNDYNTIYAQSGQFEIVEGNSPVSITQIAAATIVDSPRNTVSYSAIGPTQTGTDLSAGGIPYTLSPVKKNVASPFVLSTKSQLMLTFALLAFLVCS